MFKLTKTIALSLLILSLVAPLAFATTSRVASLAGAANYINDDSDVFRWYATLPSYNRMVMAELGRVSSTTGVSGQTDIDVSYQALGFTHSFSEDGSWGTWGIFLLRNSYDDMSFYLFNPLGTLADELGNGTGDGLETANDVSTPTTKFVLAWGIDLEAVSLGLNFTRSDYSVEVTSETAGTFGGDISMTTVGGAIRWDATDQFYGDAQATFGFLGGDTLGGFDKGTSFAIEGRGFWEMRDDLDIVPYFGWKAYEFQLQRGTPAATGPTSRGDKVNDVTLGASLNFDVNSNNMLLFATELEFNKWEFSEQAQGEQRELTQRTVPRFYIALESDINSWLTTRIGAVKNMTRTRFIDYNDATDEFEETTVTSNNFFGEDFLWTLGLGFHVAEWDIDMVVSEETPFRLGYWMTGFGAGVSDAPVGRISATYRF